MKWLCVAVAALILAGCGQGVVTAQSTDKTAGAADKAADVADEATQSAESAEAAEPEQEQDPGRLPTETAKLSYVFGMDVANALKNIDTELDRDAFFRGIADVLDGEGALLTAEEAETVKMAFFMKEQIKMRQKMQELGDKNQKEGDAYLAANKDKEGVKTTDTGLQYVVIEEGDGPNPTAADVVNVHYRGSLLDGTEFDSSYKRNEPATFPVGGVIPGWQEALQLMKVGGKYRVFVPSNLAYGERGAGQVIPPNSTLIFEVELLGIEKPEMPDETVPGAATGDGG